MSGITANCLDTVTGTFLMRSPTNDYLTQYLNIPLDGDAKDEEPLRDLMCFLSSEPEPADEMDTSDNSIEEMLSNLSIDEIDSLMRGGPNKERRWDEAELDINYSPDSVLDDVFEEKEEFQDFKFNNIETALHDLHHSHKPIKKSKIPVLVSQKTSDLFNDRNDFQIFQDQNSSTCDRGFFAPCEKSIRPRRSILKHPKFNQLNLVVDSSSGLLSDSTNYATEINSQNCEGIPIPENINEIVTIPTNSSNQAPKMAIVKAVLVARPEIRESELMAYNQGVYNYVQLAGYFKNDNDKENVSVEKKKNITPLTARPPVSQRKRVRWSNELVW